MTGPIRLVIFVLLSISSQEVDMTTVKVTSTSDAEMNASNEPMTTDITTPSSVTTTPGTAAKDSSTSTVSTTPETTVEGSSTSTVSTTPGTTAKDSSTSTVSTTPGTTAKDSSTSTVSTTPGTTAKDSSASTVSTTPGTTAKDSSASTVSTTPGTTAEGSSASTVSTTPGTTAEGSSTSTVSTAEGTTAEDSSTSTVSTTPGTTAEDSSTSTVSTAEGTTAEDSSTSTVSTAEGTTAEDSSTATVSTAEGTTAEDSSTATVSTAEGTTADESTIITVTTTNFTSANNSATSDVTTTQTTTTEKNTTSIGSTPVPAVSTKEPPVVTTTDSYAPYPPLNGKVHLRFALKVGNSTDYDSELDDTASELFSEYKEEFEDKLTEVFNSTPGFMAVEIVGFMNGSIIANYSLILRNLDIVDEATTVIDDNVTESILTIKPKNLTVDKNFTVDSLRDTINQVSAGCEYFSKDICRYGDLCQEDSNGKRLCTSRCNKTICGNHGECYVNTQETIKCKCISDEKFAYSGDHCEIQTERLKLKSEDIIAITGSVGGALVLLTLILAVLLIRERRSRPKLSERNDCQSLQASNKYQTDTPEKTVFFGREHRVSRGSDGEEVYLYQPTFLGGTSLFKESVSSTQSADFGRPNVYDYIVTDTKFEIQRPSILFGHMDKV